jgi:thiamine kinase-like enzyme
MDIIKSCTAILKKEYGIDEAVIEPQQGGWAALAFKVSSASNKYFLKVYEKNRSSTEKWTKTIDFYIPIVKWLIDNTEMKGRLVSPVYTIKGEYMCEDKENIYLLFDYIEGTTIGEKALIDTQVEELAFIIGKLHSIIDNVPLSKEPFYEDYELHFCKELLEFIEKDIMAASSDIKNILYPYIANTKDFIIKTYKLAEKLKREDLKNVLCHTDIHHWNMMQGRNLILIDWEGLKLAPPEHDSFS